MGDDRMRVALITALAALSLASSAMAADQCGSGQAASDGAEIFVFAKQTGAESPLVDYVYVEAATPDAAFKATVHYHPTGDVLGPPASLTFTAFMPLPDPAAAVYEHIAWSFDGGPWSVSKYGTTPQRRSADPALIEGYASNQVARSPTFPFREDLLAALRPGVSIALKRMDTGGHELGSGGLNYPPEAVTNALFKSARQVALTHLKPCGPPVVISNAPPRR